jgi:hypothetical protein
MDLSLTVSASTYIDITMIGAVFYPGGRLKNKYNPPLYAGKIIKVNDVTQLSLKTVIRF